VSEFEWEANYSPPYFQQNGQCKVTNSYSYVYQWHSQARAYLGPGPGTVWMCLGNPLGKSMPSVHQWLQQWGQRRGVAKRLEDYMVGSNGNGATPKRNGRLRSINKQLC